MPQSWWNKQPQCVPITPISEKSQAIDALEEQLKELEIVRGLTAGASAPEFTAWRDATISLLKRFLPPDSPHLDTFTSMHFFTLSLYPHPGEDQRYFSDGCKTAEATLKAVIKEIQRFGVHTGGPDTEQQGGSRTANRGGVHQTFHGPVTIQNQAIATDNAIQRIENMGNPAAVSLKEIAGLFERSMDLTRRQLQEGLAAIEHLALEIEKPEPSRNWKSMLEWGDTILSIATGAADLANDLALYTPAIVAVVEKARHAFGG